MTLFKIIFTWWNGQTFGTFLNTLFFGKLVGVDQFKNKYYQDKSGKRWVIYSNEAEASKIPPEWHIWIHHLIETLPSEADFKKYSWQKEYKDNMTGTSEAYNPLKSNKNNKEDYKKWSPDN